MLFCLSMGLPLLGVAMVGAISMGMAITISLTVILVIKLFRFMAVALHSEALENIKLENRCY